MSKKDEKGAGLASPRASGGQLLIRVQLWCIRFLWWFLGPRWTATEPQEKAQAWCDRRFSGWSAGVHNPLRLPLEATSEPPKVVRTPGVFKILISKCASRHNGVHFFRHLKFQKWSDNGVLCKFWLRNVLRATTACAFFNFQKWSEHGDVFCTFWLEMCFAPQRRCQKWAKREGFVAFPTTTTTTPHYIQMHCATLQLQLQIHLDYILLHYTPLHYTALNYTQLHYTTLHYTTLHCTPLHYTTLHYYTTFHYASYITLHYTPQHYNYNYTTTFRYTPLH